VAGHNSLLHTSPESYLVVTMNLIRSPFQLLLAVLGFFWLSGSDNQLAFVFFFFFFFFFFF
jgi:hypothetical protein